MPKDAFTENQFSSIWNTYIEKITKSGEHNLASILSIDTPIIRGYKICLELPNETNKLELERQQQKILDFLRKQLNNYAISFDIKINDVKEKSYVYTASEKFQKLKEKNAAIELLRITFGLDFD